MRFKNICKLVTILVFSLSLFSCLNITNKDKEQIIVSIAPLRYLIEQIVGNDFSIALIVPAGSSPETYSPTPKQMIEIEKSKALFCLGTLNFENELLKRYSKDKELKEKIIYLSDGINFVSSSCGHARTSCSHTRSIDPHIWLSIDGIEKIVVNIGSKLKQLYPDSIKYQKNTAQFLEFIDSKKIEYQNIASNSKKKAFLIYHPSLTYLANSYNIQQISIEKEGKQPTPLEMTKLIDDAKKFDIKTVLYQSEFSESVVQTIALEIGAECVEFNPLEENLFESIDRVMDIIF